MEITEVRIFQRDSEDKKLKAFATITFDDCFVVRNIKIIEGTKGLFVAMPSRKLKESCPKCGYKNPLRNKFCGQCATPMPLIKTSEDHDEKGQRQSEHRDIAHPITSEFRDKIQKKILDAYRSYGPDIPAQDRANESSLPVRSSVKPIPGTEPLGSGDIDFN